MPLAGCGWYRTGPKSTAWQEVKITHPEMVHVSGDGLYTVDAPNPWKLVKAIQELKADNDRLKAANDNMRATISADHRAIEDLRRQINAH